jgi:hypothetical protein
MVKTIRDPAIPSTVGALADENACRPHELPAGPLDQPQRNT